MAAGGVARPTVPARTKMVSTQGIISINWDGTTLGSWGLSASPNPNKSPAPAVPKGVHRKFADQSEYPSKLGDFVLRNAQLKFKRMR